MRFPTIALLTSIILVPICSAIHINRVSLESLQKRGFALKPFAKFSNGNKGQASEVTDEVSKVATSAKPDVLDGNVDAAGDIDKLMSDLRGEHAADSNLINTAVDKLSQFSDDAIARKSQYQSAIEREPSLALGVKAWADGNVALFQRLDSKLQYETLALVGRDAYKNLMRKQMTDHLTLNEQEMLFIVDLQIKKVHDLARTILQKRGGTSSSDVDLARHFLKAFEEDPRTFDSIMSLTGNKFSTFADKPLEVQRKTFEVLGTDVFVFIAKDVDDLASRVLKISDMSDKRVVHQSTFYKDALMKEPQLYVSLISWARQDARIFLSLDPPLQGKTFEMLGSKARPLITQGSSLQELKAIEILWKKTTGKQPDNREHKILDDLAPETLKKAIDKVILTQELNRFQISMKSRQFQTQSKTPTPPGRAS